MGVDCGQLVNAAIFNATLLIAARWLPGFRLSFLNIGEMLKFGLRLAAVSAIGLCSPIINRVLVGRFLGGPALGLYTMAETVSDAPNKISSAVIHQLSLPIFAKLTARRRRAAQVFSENHQISGIGDTPRASWDGSGRLRSIAIL